MKNISEKEFNEVKEKGTVLIDFYADWCGPCQVLIPMLEGLEEDTGKEIYKMNIDDETEIASELGVLSIPTVVVFQDGVEVDRMIGVKPQDDYLKYMK